MTEQKQIKKVHSTFTMVCKPHYAFGIGIGHLCVYAIHPNSCAVHMWSSGLCLRTFPISRCYHTLCNKEELLDESTCL